MQKLEPFVHLLGQQPDYLIAATAGVNPMTVRRLRVRLGIPPYSRTPKAIEKAVEQYQNGVPVLQIAADCHISLSALYNALKRRGVPLRRPKCAEN